MRKTSCVARAEFVEKEYELAFTIELAADRGTVFSSGQVLEKILGYDAAAHPHRDHLIWQLLRVPRPPGLNLVQPMWSPGRRPPASHLPSRPISLLLQYKRPDHLVGPRAAQWRLWQRPYYRFTRTKHQHVILRRLQRRLGTQAVVRYAAPAFSRRADLEHRHMRRTVIDGSGFVSPTRLGGHAVWTYRSPGTDGHANPGGQAFRFESVADLAGHLLGAVERSMEIVPFDDDPLARHVEALGDAARYRNPSLRLKVDRWMRSVLSEDVLVDGATLARVADIASITTLMTQLNGSWHVVGDLRARVD